jgi:predicted ABC-type ATPase
MENLPLLAACSDELYVYDNSGTRPVLALSVIDGEMFMTTNIPDWVEKLL